jgi:hypothetical protein
LKPRLLSPALSSIPNGGEGEIPELDAALSRR